MKWIGKADLEEFYAVKGSVKQELQNICSPSRILGTRMERIGSLEARAIRVLLHRSNMYVKKRRKRKEEFSHGWLGKRFIENWPIDPPWSDACPNSDC
ncbi:MAG TPA: hypothetical protein DD671_11540 [Balneolaceae bacterium]|nr:hypothetical protein [Balneolaceae bacterium]